MNNKPARLKKNVKVDSNKIGCKYIVYTMYNNQNYGKHCNNLCDDNLELCKQHINKEQKKCDYILAENICQHVITQQSRDLNRKGMICGNFLFNSTSDIYCKQHASRHNEEIIENKCLRSFKVKFYPTWQQKEKLNIYFGASRFTYNKLIENKEYEDDFVSLRDNYVTKIDANKDFLKITPKEIRAFAVKEFVTNRNNAREAYKKAVEKEQWKRFNYNNYKHKIIKKPMMKFKKKKDEQSITINKDSVKINNGKIKIYPTLFSNDELYLIKRSKKDKQLNKILRGVLYHDIKIVKSNTNKYYICFTYDAQKKEHKKDTEIKNVCAIDVGIRTPLTVYSEEKIVEIGLNANDKIYPLLIKRDELRKKYKKEIKKRIQEIIIAYWRLK